MSPEQISAYRKALGGNRFLMTVGAGVVTTGLLLCGCLSEASYVELTKWTVCVFIGAIASADAIGKLKGKSDANS